MYREFRPAYSSRTLASWFFWRLGDKIMIQHSFSGASPMLDAEVFRKAAAGDQDAISHLLHAYGPQARRSLSINPQWQTLVTAEDVMQVTYLEAFMRFGQLQALDAESCTAWLTRVAQNNLKDA